MFTWKCHVFVIELHESIRFHVFSPFNAYFSPQNDVKVNGPFQLINSSRNTEQSTQSLVKSMVPSVSLCLFPGCDRSLRESDLRPLNWGFHTHLHGRHDPVRLSFRRLPQREALLPQWLQREVSIRYIFQLLYISVFSFYSCFLVWLLLREDKKFTCVWKKRIPKNNNMDINHHSGSKLFVVILHPDRHPKSLVRLCICTSRPVNCMRDVKD